MDALIKTFIAFFTTPTSTQVEKSYKWVPEKHPNIQSMDKFDWWKIVTRLQKLWAAATAGLSTLPTDVVEHILAMARGLATRSEPLNRDNAEDQLLHARLWLLARDPLVLASGTLWKMAHELKDHDESSLGYDMFREPTWATDDHIRAACQIIDDDELWQSKGSTQYLLASLGRFLTDVFRKTGSIEAALGRVELLERHALYVGDRHRDGHSLWCCAAFQMDEVITLARSTDPRADALLKRINMNMHQYDHCC